MNKMPVLFVGHGSPMNIVEKNSFTKGWGEIARRIPKPQAILCISAHWYGQGLSVSSADKPKTIYDFYGFPKELYDIQYPAPGAPALAHEVADLFNGGLKIDPSRGLDHGAWSVLQFMYPEANVPICQLSINANHSPQETYQTGQHIAALREKGVLILGSGDVVHNLHLLDWNMSEGGYPWADEFDIYIKKAVISGRHDDIINYQKAGPAAQRAFFTRDHFDPFLYILGASKAGEPVYVFNEARVNGALSMTSYLIG